MAAQHDLNIHTLNVRGLNTGTLGQYSATSGSREVHEGHYLCLDGSHYVTADGKYYNVHS